MSVKEIPDVIHEETIDDEKFPITILLWSDGGVQFYGDDEDQHNVVTFMPEMWREALMFLKDKNFLLQEE